MFFFQAALEAEHEELTRIDAECADTLVGLDAACRAATHQVTACQGNLDSELHATNKVRASQNRRGSNVLSTEGDVAGV